MAEAKKKKSFARKQKKNYQMVEVDLGIFESPFEFPSLKQAPLGVSRAMNKGDIDKLIGWLETAGVPDEEIEALDTLSAEETEKLMETWSEVSEIAIPK